MKMPRKHYEITYELWANTHRFIIEKRSIPWHIWLIDRWFLWVHEWPYLISKERFVDSRWSHIFCYPYDMIAGWASGYERIDGTEECLDH